MEALTAIGLVILLAIVIIIIYRIIKGTTQVVPEGQRLVIYRLGRFHRVAGPGPVQVMPKLDRVVRAIEVRNHPIEVVVPGVFAFGVPNDLTLNLWCSFDLVKAAGGDRERLAEFVQVRNDERNRQVEVKMREALVEQIADLQKEMSLPDDATTLDGVIALAPGSERYNKLLAGVKGQLEQTLPSIGVILNTSQPITLTNRGLSPEIIEALQQKRGIDISGGTLMKYATNLKKDFPEISDAVIAQILGSIPGVDLGNLQRLLLEKGMGKAGVEDTEVEFEMPQDGSGVVNIITKTGKGRTGGGRSSQTQRSKDHLSESDLAKLKSVPRGNRSQRLSA
jgi:hypothetical protein